MAHTVFGVLPDRDSAESAINRLKDMGYDPKEISIIMKDTKEAEEMAETTGSKVATGAARGATTGGIAGALAGLLVGIGAIAIPGFGAILIGGPIAAALGLTGAAATTVSGAVTGILAGGLVGALVNLGVPEREAKVYENSVREGRILLAVPADMEHQIEVQDVMKQNGASQVNVVDTTS